MLELLSAVNIERPNQLLRSWMEAKWKFTSKVPINVPLRYHAI